MRWAYALVGFVWLVLVGRTIRTDPPVAITGEGPVASGAVEGASVADLVLPLVAVVAAAVLAGYGYVRRTRRARERTTPGGGRGETAPGAVAAAPDALDSRALALLAEADDWVRTCREELGFAEARSGARGIESSGRVVRAAAAELATAFRMRQRYDEGEPADGTARLHTLAGIVGRCEEAGRLLDAEAAAFDRLRGLEEDPSEALALAEERFRELAGRTGAAEAALADLRTRYASSASDVVTGSVEQAKDRLVFATTRLNSARQAADREDAPRAAAQLRAAEGAVAQAGVLVAGVHRLAAELDEATRLVPAALTGAEAEIAGADTLGLDVTVGELRGRVLHADAALAAVRHELTSGHPYDPLDVLRRVVRATAPLVTGRAGVLPAAALLTARATTAAAAGFVATHRGAVGGTARTRLTEAERLLAVEDGDPVELLRADTLARAALGLAEQDVRMHGNPYAGTAARYAHGVAGAVLGGVLLDGGAGDGGPPASFGGPVTRARRSSP